MRTLRHALRGGAAERRSGGAAERRSGPDCQSRAARVKHRLTRLIFAALLAVVSLASGADLTYTFTKVGPEYRLTLQPNPLLYFGFRHTGDLTQPFVTIKMALGEPSAVFGYTPALNEFQGFFRARGISISSPEDQDGDYMDDLWELQHPYLDPLAPNDAFLPSPEADAAGRNNLDYYIFKLGIIRLREVFSRETTVFNFGAAVSRIEAISREATVFNFGSPPVQGVEAISREISLFNGESVPSGGIPEVYSREITAFNFGSPPANIEAISRSVSVFNGESVPSGGISEVYSREVTTFNFGAPSATTEAISRAVTVLNTAP